MGWCLGIRKRVYSGHRFRPRSWRYRDHGDAECDHGGAENERPDEPEQSDADDGLDWRCLTCGGV